MQGTQLQHLIEKLYDMDKQMGGNAKKAKNAKGASEYDSIKEIVLEKLFSLNKKQNERDEKLKKFGNDRDNIALGVKIRDDMFEIDRNLKNMDDALIRQGKNPKKYPKNELQAKYKQYQNLCSQLENCKQRELGGDYSNNDNDQVKVQTLTEQKYALMNGGNQGYQNRQVRYEMNKDEEEALARWQKNDQEMDPKLDQINDGLDQMKGKAMMIGDKLDHTKVQIGTLVKEVDKTNLTLNNSNRQLKELLIKFRQPNKFCLDIVLVLLFIGLIGVAYNMYQKQKK